MGHTHVNRIVHLESSVWDFLNDKYGILFILVKFHVQMQLKQIRKLQISNKSP